MVSWISTVLCLVQGLENWRVVFCFPAPPSDYSRFSRPAPLRLSVSTFLFPPPVHGYYMNQHRASLVAQLVENPPAMQVTWVRSLGWEDPLEKGKATRSSILAWRIP